MLTLSQLNQLVSGHKKASQLTILATTLTRDKRITKEFHRPHNATALHCIAGISASHSAVVA